jgi:hypothetical protein
MAMDKINQCFEQPSPAEQFQNLIGRKQKLNQWIVSHNSIVFFVK